MRRIQLLAASALAVPLVAIASSSGPEWGEPCDAGNLPGTATPVTGTDGVFVLRIVGELNDTCSASDGGPAEAQAGGDFQDMFVIKIVDPVTSFSACLDPAMTGFDTQIWLFRFDTESGVIANDDDIATGGPFSCMGSMSNDGSGFAVTTPGLYYLAISGFDSDPFSIPGRIFDQATRTETSGADGPGGSTPIVTWVPPIGATGRYAIDVTGVVFIDCPADFDHNGYVDFQDLLRILTAWGPCAGCPEDLDGGGDVDVRDVVRLLGLWGRCV